MSKLEFKPSDFEPQEGMTLISRTLAAEIANTKLNEMLASCMVVYGRKNQYNLFEFNQYKDPENGPDKRDTHTARLIDIQELPMIECEHEPYLAMVLTSLPPQEVYKCKHCGVELVATWKAKCEP